VLPAYAPEVNGREYTSVVEVVTGSPEIIASEFYKVWDTHKRRSKHDPDAAKALSIMREMLTSGQDRCYYAWGVNAEEFRLHRCVDGQCMLVSIHHWRRPRRKTPLGFLSKLFARDGVSGDERESRSGSNRELIDVNTYQWQDQAASAMHRQGCILVTRGMVSIAIYGADDDDYRQQASMMLHQGIEHLENALRMEQPSIPLPYKYLTEGYSFLAFCTSYESRNDAHTLYRKAIESAKTALRYYDQTTGWDEGLRHDFHYALAVAFLSLGDVKQGEHHLDRARAFRRDNSMLVTMADRLESVRKGN
jgi:hypothetical protein